LNSKNSKLHYTDHTYITLKLFMLFVYRYILEGWA